MAEEKMERTTATAGAENEGNENQQGQEQEAEPKVIELTEEELQARLQAEGDKRVDEAIKTHKPKWEAEAREREKKARADAERLARMSAEEREKEQLKLKEEEYSRKEKDLHQREMKLAAIDILAEEKLPITFADQLIGESVDDTYDRITKFKKAWNEAIEEEVKDRLKGQIPDTGERQPPKLDMNQHIRRMAGRS